MCSDTSTRGDRMTDETVEPWQLCCLQIAKARTGRTPKMSVRELAERIQSLGFARPKCGAEFGRQLEAGARPWVADDVRLRARHFRFARGDSARRRPGRPRRRATGPSRPRRPVSDVRRHPGSTETVENLASRPRADRRHLASWNTFYLGPLTSPSQRRRIRTFRTRGDRSRKREGAGERASDSNERRRATRAYRRKHRE